jgi:hypothetical protein
MRDVQDAGEPWMQVNPVYPQHIRTKECGVRMDRRLQQELAISLALALQCKITVNGSVFGARQGFQVPQLPACAGQQ